MKNMKNSACSADSSVSTDIVLRQGGGKELVIASSAAYKSVTASGIT